MHPKNKEIFCRLFTNQRADLYNVQTMRASDAAHAGGRTLCSSR